MTCKIASRALLVLLASAIAACGGPTVVVIQATPPPGWVDRIPKRTDALCAVGYSGATFYQQDCLKNAADNGRGHLADTISASIKTITIDISDGTRGMFSRDVFVQGSETASDVVLEGSEVEGQWVDQAGARGAPKGCYAMVCIDPNKPMEKVLEELKEKKIPPKTIEKVRENAAAAFDDLEKHEAKHEKKAAPAPAPAPKQPEVQVDDAPAPKQPEAQQVDDAPPSKQPEAQVDDAPPPSGAEAAPLDAASPTPEGEGSSGGERPAE
jgi:hypothetical protein